MVAYLQNRLLFEDKYYCGAKVREVINAGNVGGENTRKVTPWKSIPIRNASHKLIAIYLWQINCAS